MTKPLPAHGTYARSVGRPGYGIKGCSCPRCKHARNKYRQRRALLNATGRNLMVPAGPAIAHLRHLSAEGATRGGLSRAIGCSSSTVFHLTRGNRIFIRRSVESAVLRVQLADVLAPWQPVKATGGIRRVHALMAIGHFAYDIADACGVDKSVIVHLTNGQLTTVRADTADKIRTGYAVLYTKAGGSTRNRRRAEREGWHGPLAWDDDIDDPNAEPEVVEAPDLELKRDELAAQRREEVWLLATAGESNDEIARRIGVAISTVQGIRLELRRGVKRDRTKQQMEAAA